MRAAALIAFVCGVCLLQWQVALPAAKVMAFVGCVAVIVLLVAARFRERPAAQIAGLIAIACAGFVYAATQATWRMSDELAIDDEGRDFAVTGTIASLPVRLEDRKSVV